MLLLYRDRASALSETFFRLTGSQQRRAPTVYASLVIDLRFSNDNSENDCAGQLWHVVA